jgi:hypothetical protein
VPTAMGRQWGLGTVLALPRMVAEVLRFGFVSHPSYGEKYCVYKTRET